MHERFMRMTQKGSNPMTRSSKLALVTLLAGLLSLASAATVNANVGAPCTGYAQEHCEQMAAMNDVALFSVAAPAHTLAGNGMGQEHFEAMSADQVAVFSVAPDATTSIYPYAEALTPTIGHPR
jgi:hypothetical protein